MSKKRAGIMPVIQIVRRLSQEDHSGQLRLHSEFPVSLENEIPAKT